MIKHFIWDFDGTLFDSYPITVELLKNMLLENNIEEDYNDILKLLLISEKTAIDFYVDKYKLNSNLGEEFVHRKKDLDITKIKELPFASEVCRKIKSLGFNNYLLTHRGETAIEILKNNDMLELFTEVITRDSGFKRKPDPESIHYLMDKYNFNNDEALIIGDRELEIALGKNSNVKICFYNSGNIETPSTPDYVINSLKDIFEIINK